MNSGILKNGFKIKQGQLYFCLVSSYQDWKYTILIYFDLKFDKSLHFGSSEFVLDIFEMVT